MRAFYLGERLRRNTVVQIGQYRGCFQHLVTFYLTPVGVNRSVSSDLD